MALKHVLARLVELEAEGAITAGASGLLTGQYDPTGNITLTIHAERPDVRDALTASVLVLADEPVLVGEPAVKADPHEAATVAAKAASKKTARKASK